VVNILALHALSAPIPRLPTVPPRVTGSPAPAGGTVPTPPAAGACKAPGERRELGPRVRNASRDIRFTGNTDFVENIQTRRVEEAINLAGGRDTMPKVTRCGEAGVVCISHHAHGACYELCPRAASHTRLSAAEAV
jgi:hypothetical protein